MNKNIRLKNAAIAVILATGLQACEQASQTPQTVNHASSVEHQKNNTPTEPKGTSQPVNTQTSIDEAAKQIDEAEFMKHVNILASDEFEGRAPSTPGGEKTVSYLEKSFAEVGLKPAFVSPSGTPTYRQAVELTELTVTNSPALTLTHSDATSVVLPYKEKSIVFTSRQDKTSKLKDSKLVFVGYGVVAPEYGWNDYQGVDMTGKTAVILVNDPGYRKPKGDLFKGQTMTYYGRWTYKFEEAARQGAAGAIVVHENGAAGYPWAVVSGSWSGAQYKLRTKDSSQSQLAVEAWITKNAAQDLFAANGLDYSNMVAKATEPGFTPVSLTSTASSELKLSSRKSKSYNVGGVIQGSAAAEEAFIYTAHWDHLGVKRNTIGKDKIFNGAQDNATGTAGLIEMAQAFNALPKAPARSVIFLAVTAEESGLLGSKQYADSPAFPMSKTVAGINIDSMSTAGASNDVVVIGYGNSELDDYLKKVVEPQGRKIVPEPTPEKGFFYRSDHFNLAKKGVPMLYAKAGQSIRGKNANYGPNETRKYVSQRYHKPGDEVHAEWDNGGIMQDLDASFHIGLMISDSADWPKWSEGNEFKAIREESQRAQ